MPIGAIQLPSAATESGCRMPVAPQSARANVVRNIGAALSSVTSTVCGSSAFTDSTRAIPLGPKTSRHRQRVAGFKYRCNDQTTSAEVSGVPLWNTTSGRSAKVYTRPSEEMVHRLANMGPTDPSSCDPTRPSTMWSSTPSVFSSRRVPGSVETMSELSRARSNVACGGAGPPRRRRAQAGRPTRPPRK